MLEQIYITIIKSKEMLKLGLYWISWLTWLALIPLYICLTPICMISSALFDWFMSWIVEDQDFILMTTLIIEWGLSALLICQLVFNRTFRSIFFYEFVFFLVCSNCAMIGITYSILDRYNFAEELTAKICTTLLLILIAQKMKIKVKNENTDCQICFLKMNNQCIILKCSHYFHEDCLWDWAYVKQECPTCKKAFS